MKKITAYSLLLAALILSSSFIQENVNCDIKVLKKELKSELRPDFKYDSSNINHFTLESKKQGTEVHVPLFSTEKYKLLFNTAGISSDFDILIYDKAHNESNRKLLFSVKGSEAVGKHIFSFEPSNQKEVYIDYMLPASSEKDVTGCMVFLMGYKIG
ncbi:MAG: hypothetical protein ACPGSL_08620 [Vicingaceae bacterium]